MGGGGVTGLFYIGSGIIVVANKTKVLNENVTNRLTRRNTGVIVLSHTTRINRRVMTSVGTGKKRTDFFLASMLGGRVLRRGGGSVLTGCNHVSTLLGTTNNGVTNTAVKPSDAVFSLGVSTFHGIMSLGLFKAILPAVMFTSMVTGRERNTVIGFSSRSTLHPLAHIINCNTTGTTVSGLAGCLTNRLTVGFKRNLHMGTVTPKFFLARRGHALVAGPSKSCAPHTRSIVTRAPFEHLNAPSRLFNAVRCLVDSTSGFMAKAVTVMSNNFSTFSVWSRGWGRSVVCLYRRA